MTTKTTGPLLVPSRDLKFWIDCINRPGSVAYNSARKSRFINISKRVLRSLADHLMLEPEQYEIRVNKGGIAVSGDIILATDVFRSEWPIDNDCSGIAERGLYVQVNCDVCDWVMVRTTTGRKDYYGGTNHAIKAEEFRDMPKLAEKIIKIR